MVLFIRGLRGLHTQLHGPFGIYRDIGLARLELGIYFNPEERSLYDLSEACSLNHGLVEALCTEAKTSL